MECRKLSSPALAAPPAAAEGVAAGCPSGEAYGESEPEEGEEWECLLVGDAHPPPFA